MSERPEGERLSSVEALYGEIILSHHRRPRNRRELVDPSVRVECSNPTCGDEIALALRVEGERITEVGFTGEGCSISQSSASIMSTLLEGRTLQEAAELGEAFRALVQGRIEPREARQLGDLRALSGVSKFPLRVRCAMLAWEALDQAGRLLGGGPADQPPRAG